MIDRSSKPLTRLLQMAGDEWGPEQVSRVAHNLAYQDGEDDANEDDGWPGAGPDEWRDEAEPMQPVLHVAAKPGDIFGFVVGEDGTLARLPVPSRRRGWFRRG
jgi:hypothetical protein